MSGFNILFNSVLLLSNSFTFLLGLILGVESLRGDSLIRRCSKPGDNQANRCANHRTRKQETNKNKTWLLQKILIPPLLKCAKWQEKNYKSYMKIKNYPVITKRNVNSHRDQIMGAWGTRSVYLWPQLSSLWWLHTRSHAGRWLWFRCYLLLDRDKKLVLFRNFHL